MERLLDPSNFCCELYRDNFQLDELSAVLTLVVQMHARERINKVMFSPLDTAPLI